MIFSINKRYNAAVTLDQAPLGAPRRVRGFRELSDAERARLSALGLREGCSVTKIRLTPLRDPVQCLVGPQLLALERWLLARIEVE